MRRCWTTITVLLGACGGPPAATAVTTPAPAPATSASADTNASPAPASSSDSARKRTRTAPPTPLAHDGTKPKNGRPLNPKDNLDRTVFVRADDHCFVEVPPKGATEVVDCPPATDDAAWDQCTAQIVLDGSGGKCFCVTGAGNPRPMPRPTPCPASAKSN